ncbi:MAG: GGDEF domain-containing protein [Tepidisphaeraceae bacterium]
MHPLLDRQLQRAFGADRPAGLEKLLAAVDAAYADFDGERQMLERSMMMANEELLTVNGRLQTDLHRRELAEAALRHAATHDELTGLANRSLLLERLNQRLHSDSARTNRRRRVRCCLSTWTALNSSMTASAMSPVIGCSWRFPAV